MPPSNHKLESTRPFDGFIRRRDAVRIQISLLRRLRILAGLVSVVRDRIAYRNVDRRKEETVGRKMIEADWRRS